MPHSKVKLPNWRFTPGAPISNEFGADGMSKADKEAIKTAILNAKTLEEIEKLTQMLQSGQVPGKAAPVNGKSQNGTKASGNNVVEMDED